MLPPKPGDGNLGSIFGVASDSLKVRIAPTRTLLLCGPVFSRNIIRYNDLLAAAVQKLW